MTGLHCGLLVMWPQHHDQLIEKSIESNDAMQ